MVNPPITPLLGWTLFLFLAALCFVLAAGAQIATSYATAYVAAPRDLAALLDAVDALSVPAGHESYYCYDDDVDADTECLGRHVRAIHRERDALRRHLRRLLRRRADGTAALTPGARILWAGHRGPLEERVRRLDRRRMRFLLDAYPRVVAAAVAREKAAAPRPGARVVGTGDDDHDDDDDHHHHHHSPPWAASGGGGGGGGGRGCLPVALAEAIRKPAALRRSTAPAAPASVEKMTPPPSPSPSHRAGWAGVVQELRASPRMQKRRASVEQSMRASPPRFGRDATRSPGRRPPL